LHPLSGILGGAGLVLAACLGLGRAAWPRAPHWTLQLASGSALLATAVFVLLVLQWAHPAVILPLCLAATVPLWRGLQPPPKPGVPLWLLAPMAAYAFYYLIHALAPEIQPDAAGYHLGLVADWARRHGMAARIGFYDLLPLGLETLFYPAFLLGGHSAAKLVHYGYFLATVPLIWWIGQKLGLHSSVSFCASGLYFLTPVAGISGTCAYNDAAAAFFPLAAFGAVLCAGQDRRDFFYAGLAAGFAYAVKMPGAAAALGAAAWSFWRGGRRAALLCCAGIALAAGPWLARNAVLTGNPLAPLGNRLFPNAHFHAASEQHLSRHLASYNVSGPAGIARALALDGAQLQGLAGPMLLLLPLGLLAARTPSGRLLLAAGLLLLLPWTRNLGARFLLPALPFLFLALASAVGARGAVALFLVQAVAVAPWLVDRYASPYAWRLHGFPWQAALRLEPEQHYLRSHLYEFPFAEKAAPIVGRERLLDLYGLPFSYMNTAPLGPLTSAEFDNAAIALTIAASARPERIAVLRAPLPARFTRAVRIRLEMDWPGLWSIQDVTVEWRGRPAAPSRHWKITAFPNPGGAWLAADGNPATRWYTWDDSRKGAWWQLTFPRPRPAGSIEIHTIDAAPFPPVSVFALNTAGQWENLTGNLQRVSVERRVWRRQATAYLYRLGIRWIAAPLDTTSYAPLGQSLHRFPAAWGVTEVLAQDGLALFRIEPPASSR
jgi:hypothetical protein